MANKPLARLWKILSGLSADAREEGFLLEDGLSKLERFAHFWVLVTRSFIRNRCPVRASALSYATLLALIPLLAVAMSVTSMFLKSEGQDQIETFIQQFVEQMVPSPMADTNLLAAAFAAGASFYSPPEQALTNDLSAVPSAATNLALLAAPTNTPSASLSDARVLAARKKAAGYIHEFIQNTYSGTLGIAGVVFLLWTAIVMLARVEETFNDIWGVARGRNWLSRVVLYWTTITLGPLLLVAALGLASGPHFQKTRALITVVPFLEPLVSQLLPVAVISLTFALFYKLMPNTKVHFSAALVGGTLAATAWHLFNLISLHLASRAVNASAIYGSLALVPLLMLGLYAVWVIVLFGAQVAYAFQNRAAYLQDKLAENVNQRGREFVALRLTTCLGQRFHHGQPPATIPEMSRELGVPSRLVQQVLQTLIAAHLVTEVSGAEPAYTPTRPLENINAHHVLQAMRATVGQELVTRDEPVRAEVYGEFARIQEAERQAASSVTMLALVNRAQARLELVPPTPIGEEIKLKPAFVPPAETAPQPIHVSAAPPKVEPEVRAPATEAEAEPDQSVTPARPFAEPAADEERDFPL